MIILDQNDELIQNPDFELGYLRPENKVVFLSWIIDKPEEKEEYLIKYYEETGGKEIGYRTIQIEEGHWEVFDKNGNIVEFFDKDIPEGIPHDQSVPDIWEFQRYILFTPEELEQNAINKANQEAVEAKEAEREVMLEELPDTLASTDDAICQLYEMVLEASNV